jgi:hypothetical protein
MLKPKPKRSVDPVVAYVSAACVDDPTPPSSPNHKDARDNDWRRVSLLVPPDMLVDIDAISSARAMPRNVWLRTAIVEALDVAKERAARASAPIVGEVGCAFLKAAHMRTSGT